MKLYYSTAKIQGNPWDVVMFDGQTTVDESVEIMGIVPRCHVEVSSGEVTILTWPKPVGYDFWSAFARQSGRLTSFWRSEEQSELGLAVVVLSRVPAMARRFNACLQGQDRFRAEYQGNFYDYADAFDAARAKERASWGTPKPPFPGPPPPPFSGWPYSGKPPIDWSKVNFHPFSGHRTPPPSPPPAPPDAYSVLGLSPGAARADVLAAHKRLAKENHPDRGGDGERLAKINVARDQILGTGVGAPKRRAGF